MTVRLTDDILAELTERARAAGVSPEEYVQRLLRDALTRESHTRLRLTDAEFHAVLDRLAGSISAPPLPPDFSRADIYADHD